MRQAVAANQRIYPISKWRKIMRTKTVKLATAAAVLVAALVLTTFDRFADTAWSVEQTIAAIQKLETLHIKGECFWGPDSDPEILDFDFWVQFLDEDSEVLKMRFECDKRIIVVQGETAYQCWPDSKVANVVNGPDIGDLKFWYKAADFSPWLTGKMLQTLRLFSDDWKEVVQYDPNTGKKQILVTCGYAPSEIEYSIVVDAESKLFQTATMSKKGQVCFNAQVFTYNQEAPTDAFKLPVDYNIFNEQGFQESRALYNRAGQLFVEKKYTEALKLYQQGYEQYGSLNNGRVGRDMLYMVGMCYPEIGQFDKMLDTFLKHISEYSHLEGSDDAHWCLGLAYEELGQTEKALEAYEKCILIYEGLQHEPDNQYPLKNARKRIEKIKAEQDSRPSP
jgi:tetratricopeptide (TPR) repeat protein